MRAQYKGIIESSSIVSRQHQPTALRHSSFLFDFKMMFISILLAFFLYFNSLVTAADTSAWKSRSIYFVLTDRIARSGSDTGGGSCGNLGNYCGGTFSGLESKLDYIKGLGFDAIWITPVVASTYTHVQEHRGSILTGNRLCWWLSRVLGSRPVCHQLQLWYCGRSKEPRLFCPC